MTPRLLTLGSCAWIKISTLGFTPRRLKRTMKGAVAKLGTTIEYQYPYVRMVPKSYNNDVRVIHTHLRRKLERYSTPTPWGAEIRYLPTACMASLAEETQKDFNDYKALTHKVLSSWDKVHEEAMADLRVMAAREYLLHDPFGFVNKRVWIENYINEMVGLFPTKEEVEAGMSAMIVLGSYGPALTCPPGFHTIGHEAMASWAEDFIEETWTPLRASLQMLRQACTLTDKIQAANARAQAYHFPVRANKMITWACHSDRVLETMVEEALQYFLSMKEHIMAPQNEDVRRRLADLTLLPLLYMASPKNLKDRVAYLLEEI